MNSITVGEAPTHIVTIPTVGPETGVLTVPLSADDKMMKVRDEASGLKIIDSASTGEGKTHPHGHWLTCGTGDRTIVPNVFKGIGPAGSVSIMDTASGAILREFEQNPSDPLTAPLLMPIAVGECHVNGVAKAYVANLVSGMVTAIKRGHANDSWKHPGHSHARWTDWVRYLPHSSGADPDAGESG